ncbi:MAG: hypothetical protein ABIR98_14330 [Usitatibacter sp.]
MERTALTPGKLYARLSAEFRRLRPEHCGSCRMPLVVLTRGGPGECNWIVEPTSKLCGACEALIAEIVQKAAREYDLRDPISVPYFPQSAPDAHAPCGLRR